MMREQQRAKVRDYMLAGAALLESLHVRETQGQNRGEIVSALLRLAGGSSPDAWCAAFCDVCYDAACHQAQVPHDFNIGLSVSACVKAADALGRYHEDPARVKRGDLLVLKGGKTGYKHIGICTGPLDTRTRRIPTIEGNTNAAGSAEGDGIYRKERDPARLPMGFISM